MGNLAETYVPGVSYAAINPSSEVIVPGHYTTYQKRTPPLPKLTAAGYGAALKVGKQKLRSACQAAGASIDEQVVLMSMAMRETETLNCGEYDWQKDTSNDGSANVSIFNANLDFLERVNGRDWRQLGSKASYLNSDAGLSTVVAAIIKGFRDPAPFGKLATLRYIRGGYESWSNPASTKFKPLPYLMTLKATISYVDGHRDLLSNEFKVAREVPHV